MTMQVETARVLQSAWGALALARARARHCSISPPVWALLFLANVDVGLPIIDAPMRGTLSTAVTINTLLLAAFRIAPQHHGAAAHARIGRAADRATDGAAALHPCSAGALMAVMALWQPIPVALWSVAGAPARAALWALTDSAGSWSSPRSTRSTNGAFSGCARRSRRCAAPRAADAVHAAVALPRGAPPDVSRADHRVLGDTDMSVGHALYAGGMTLYILVGVRFEERGLTASFGETYRDYQRRVPMLLPWPR